MKSGWKAGMRWVAAALGLAAMTTAAAAEGRPEIVVRTLPNGVRLLLCAVEGCPTVSLQMVMRGGLAVESAETVGTSPMMARLLLKGAGGRTAEDSDAAIEALGAEASGGADLDTIRLSAQCPADRFEKTFDLVAESLLRPTFSAEEIEQARAVAIYRLARTADVLQGEAMYYFHRVFFPESPYQFPIQGSPEVIESLDRERLAAWHKKCLGGNNLVIAVFGGIDLATAANHVAAAVESLPPRADLVFPTDQMPRKVTGREVYIKLSEKAAAIVLVGYPGTDVYDLRDRFAMDVLEALLGGGPTSGGRFGQAFQEKGLTAGFRVVSLRGLRPGYFAVRAICRPEEVPEVVRVIESVMARAAQEPFAEADVAVARQAVIASRERRRESLDGQALEAATDEAIGLGCRFGDEEINRLGKVQPEDVQRVARRMFVMPVICVVTSDPEAAEAIRRP